ncbi:hypothetical protein [Aquabacterium sp.]|uniref:hypothetical protein n=1 Tax=Aquabacterium sp. TaxID=1872578 RepID=UPI00198CC500|nr:hypothetical protein [Aquabacterium sp.]MBC7699449.1 hypothetical protein [Aquabacterium sp.]
MNGAIWLLRASLCAAVGINAPLISHAETSLERQIFSEPSPHKGLRSEGRAVAAHWARYVEQVGNEASNQKRMTQLRRAVAECAHSNRESGLPVVEINQWPIRLNSVRVDVYVAVDRVATYSHGVAYVLNPQNCALLEHESLAATVRSLQGVCKVDLLSKAANSSCANGNQRVRRLPLSAVASRPGFSPLAVQSPFTPRVTGERRTVAGHTCDVATNPLDPNQGTHCYARGGGFPGHGPRVVADGTALVIESISAEGFVFRADEVVLDMAVSVSIFSPESSAGIRVERAEE